MICGTAGCVILAPLRLEELARDKRDSEPRAFCDSCAVGKQHRTSPKPLGAIRAERKLQLVYSDVMGPVSVAPMTNKRFMISFTDDKTRISSVAFMAKKSEALEKVLKISKANCLRESLV